MEEKKLPVHINSILVIQLAGLGDMVLATPAINALKDSYPRASISLLTNGRSAELIAGSKQIDDILILNNTGDLLKIAGLLRSRHYDIVINLARLYSFIGAIKMCLLFWLINGKFSLGRNTDGKGFFYTLKVPEALKELKHEVESKIYVISAMGADVKKINFSLNISHNDEQFIDKFLSQKGIKPDERFLVINCSTFRPSRNWPAEYYAELSNQLNLEIKRKIIFIGVSKEKAFFIRIKKLLNFEPLDFIGVFTVKQLVAFLKRSSLLISPDSGVVHIANSLGIPLVELFGPGEFHRYHPYNNVNAIVINKNAECAPCFKTNCRNKKCMELIKPNEVLAAVKQLYNV